MANGQAFRGIFGGAARGLAAGARIGLGIREVRRREEEGAARKETQELTANIGKLGVVSKLLSNKDLPKQMKLDIFNSTFVPTFNKIFTRSGSEVDDDMLIGTLDEFPDALDDFMKRAFRVINNPDLTITQRVEALGAIQVEAGKDINLAPQFALLKEKKKAQTQRDTIRYQELLEDGGITPPEVAEAALIKQRSPKAVIDAGVAIDKKKTEVPLSQQVKDILGGKGIDVSKLDVSRPLDASFIREARRQAKEERFTAAERRGAGGEIEKRRSAFAQSSFRVQDAVQNIDQIVKTLDETPEVFGASGSVAVSVVGVADQVGSFARIINPNFSMDQTVAKVFDRLDDVASGSISESEFTNKATEPFRARLEKVARGNRVLQGRIMGLAISLATVRAIDGRGRLTSDMVNRQIEEIGATIQSPQAFRASILRVRSDLISRLEDRRRIMLGGEAPTFGQPPQRPEAPPGTVQVTPEIQTPPAGLRIPTLNEAQQRAIQEAEEGQEFTLGGQRFIKRGGTLVPAGR